MERSSRMQLWKDMGGNLTEKDAELANTYDMPQSPSPQRRNAKRSDQTVIQKSASADLSEDDILKLAFEVKGNEGSPVTGENPASHPQSLQLKPSVDVSGKEPPKMVTEKKAQRYALPLSERYPLDSYAEVKQASAYFDEWHLQMAPSMRREFCLNMVKRASELGIPVSGLAAQYGGTQYADPSHIKIALDARRTVLHAAMDPLHKVASDRTDVDVLEKLAQEQPGMYPESFAAALKQFDELTGLSEHWGGDVPDPYLSTYKTAAEVEKQEWEIDPDESIIIGNEILPLRKLVTFAKIGWDTVRARFGEEFADEFAKQPKVIFDSLPRDQKLVLLRMASAVRAQNQTATTS